MQWIRVALTFALGLIVLTTLVAPLAASAQNLGTSPQFGQAVQGQQATTVEGTVLNIVNWSCNVIAPVIAVACLGIAGWHFKSGRGCPAVRTWIVPKAIKVLPAPHSATMRAAFAWRRYFAVPVMARPCAGRALRSKVATAGATGSLVLWSGG
jgi:hypothetical protein